MSEIINKIITITSVESKLTSNGKTMLKVGDTDNRHYQIWKTKADGSESVAYQRLMGLGDPIGKTVEIGYNETQGDYQGKPRTYKTIINIGSVNGRQPSKADMFVKAQMTEASKKNEDDKWGEINEKKEKSIKWMNALNNSTLLASSGKIELKDLKYQANLIYQMKPLDGGEEVETIPVEDEELLKNIPF